MQFSKSLLFTAVALIAPLAIEASPISPSPTLSIDGLTFSNFTCNVISTVGAGGMVSPTSCLAGAGTSGIAVNTITFPGIGVEFDSSGFMAANASQEDIRINYTVTSAAPITTIGLDFNASIAGQAVSSVTETVDNSVGGFITQASVNVGSVDFGSDNILSTNIALNGGYTTLNVQKDINLTATADSSAQGSFIQQTFSTVPEPGTTALMGGGLMLFGLILRKRFSQKQAA
jgi:hypothetical protein